MHILRLPQPLSLLLSLLLLVFALPLSAADPEPPRHSYTDLATLLDDEASRTELIAALRTLAAGTEAEAVLIETPETEAPSGMSEDEISFARQMANLSQATAQRLVSEFAGGVGALTALAGAKEAINLTEVAKALSNLAIVIVATLLLFIILRRLFRPLFGRINRWSVAGKSAQLLRHGLAIIGAALLDLLAVLLAWVGGYALALFVVGEPGVMDPRESLFLNAFLLVEVFKVALRALFAARDEHLRLMPIPAEDAAYWNAWLARLSGFMGYGILLVVPMINFNISPALGSLVTLFIVGLAFIYAVAVITQNRASVAQGLQQRANQADMVMMRVLLGMLARSWHWLAMAYVAALALATLLRPEDALPLILLGTVESLVAIGIGIFAIKLLTQVISRQLQLPEETRRRFPMLEGRLNGFVPKAIKAMKLVVFVVVTMVVLDAWNLFNLPEWLSSETGSRTVAATLSVAVILLLATVLWIGLASWIEQRLNPETGNGEPSAREKTLLTIFRNAVAIALVIVTSMIVLAEIGINIGPLIAGAGVLGLAIGFGAQKLVQDVITGVFIQLENAINSGDIVTAAGVTGTAEKLTIRSLSIRDLSGTYHLIPFSSVDTVANYMRDFAYHVGVYGVAYRENVDEVIVLLRNAFDELVADPDQRKLIINELEVHGVTALGDSAVDIRVRIKTLPGSQWSVGRAYNRLVKMHLDAAGVEIPFPHMTLYFGQDKDGSAPPAPVVLQSPAKPLENKDAADGDSSRSDTNAEKKGDFDDADD